MVDSFDQGNAAAEMADADKYANLTWDELVACGLVEGKGYRDFPPPNDCFPEDGDER